MGLVMKTSSLIGIGAIMLFVSGLVVILALSAIEESMIVIKFAISSSILGIVFGSYLLGYSDGIGNK